MVFDRKRPREQWCCSKASCHHHPIANDKTHKKKILNKKNKKRRKEEGKTLSEKRWRWIILTSSCDVKCSGGLTVWHLRHKLPREREDDIHKSYHTHSRTPAFLDFGDLPTCHCYDAQCQGAKICWTLGEEKQR